MCSVNLVLFELSWNLHVFCVFLCSSINPSVDLSIPSTSLHHLCSPSFPQNSQIKTPLAVLQPSQMGWRWQVTSINPTLTPPLSPHAHKFHTLTVYAQALSWGYDPGIVCVWVWEREIPGVKPTVSPSSCCTHVGSLPSVDLTPPQPCLGLIHTHTHTHWLPRCLSHFFHHSCAHTCSNTLSVNSLDMSIHFYLCLPPYRHILTHTDTHTRKHTQPEKYRHTHMHWGSSGKVHGINDSVNAIRVTPAQTGIKHPLAVVNYNTWLCLHVHVLTTHNLGLPIIWTCKSLRRYRL